MRLALIVMLGFGAVFVWTLIAAPGSDGPPLDTTRYCGTWRPAGPAPHRHVAFANRMSCGRALSLAATYQRTRTCPVHGTCKASVAGLKCFTKGAAGPRLTWIGCELPDGDAPRAVFSVDRV